MSEDYIRNHFADIKGYANTIENHLDDEWCTMESVLADNAKMLDRAQKFSVAFTVAVVSALTLEPSQAEAAAICSGFLSFSW